jgi:MFS family permease
VTRLGLRANARQFALLLALNALVGSLVGLERSVLPLVGERDFGIASQTAILAFVAAFGLAKALANLAAGSLADRAGRKRLLVAGWLLAAPVPVLVGLGTEWWHVVAANLFLGASQGLAWSMTVVMKIDLVGPRRRGLALGLNESAGYLGLAAAAFATGLLAASVAPRTLVWAGALAVVVVGASASALFVRDTAGHMRIEESSSTASGASSASFRAAAQAGFVNNLNDAVVWGLVPLHLAAGGASIRKIGVVAAVYPAVWGVGQVGTGWLSDLVGRKPLIVSGMLLQALALVLLLSPAPVAAAALLGAGTALVYPTLIASVSDGTRPQRRARAVGRYRFWRDIGFVAGAVGAGVCADAYGSSAAIVLVAALTAVSGVWFAASPSTLRPTYAGRLA